MGVQTIFYAEAAVNIEPPIETVSGQGLTVKARPCRERVRHEHKEPQTWTPTIGLVRFSF